MAFHSPLPAKKQAALGHMLLLILAVTFLAFVAIQATERRAEPKGLTTTHEVGVPLFGTLAGG
jgi:hypothetical protein